jgi:outer membrane protein OmpA-like peptidoglycan-associated protein
MSAPRRDSNHNRDVAASVTRIWQQYADEIGIPDTATAAAREPLPPRTERRHARGHRRTRITAELVGGIFAAVAVVGVASVGGIVLWRSVATSPDTVERRSPPVAVARTAATTGDVGTVTQEPVTARTPSGEIQRTPPVQSPRESGDMRVRVTFDFGSDQIDHAAKLRLRKIVNAMDANPHWRLAIEGHSDAHGPPDYNRSLSERRAYAVKTYLESAGIRPERLSAVGFGASRPLTTDDAQGTALNRRVEIRRRLIAPENSDSVRK